MSKAYARTDDVHDRVHCADFVEMNFFERDVVYGGFGFAEFAENRASVLAYSIGELRFFEDFENRSQAAMFRFALRLRRGRRWPTCRSSKLFRTRWSTRKREVPRGQREAEQDRSRRQSARRGSCRH